MDTHAPFLSLRRYRPDENAVALLGHEVARRLCVLPLFVIDDELYLAMPQPGDLDTQDFVRQMTGLNVRPVQVERADLEDAMTRHYLGKDKSAQHIGAIASEERGVAPAASVHLEDSDAPVIRLVNYILQQAIALGASDVHLEPFAERSLLRYRVDGVLHEFPAPPPHMLRAVVARIKILADMDTSERRLPQDGRAAFDAADRAFDLRVSTVPTLHGEGVVIRLLDPHGVRRSLSELGMGPGTLESLQRLLRRPHGMLVVAGPTGAGKTTTLYAALSHIFTPRRKFITLEDPVEYQLDGVTQMQVNSDIGMTFAHGLRAVLRQDPDVIMVGEIRDLESAEIAVRASMTGHLLFTSLHTNDATQAVTRLIDLGVPAFYVLSSLAGVLAQRLMRRLCTECRVPLEVTPALLSALRLTDLPPRAVLYGARGCSACGNLGYRGRIGIYELLEIDADMRRLSPHELQGGQLRALANARGLVSLRDSALVQLFSGTTSLEEVLSVTTED
jgi:type II secretory ATPase GspE/PulE/Tfp pilus assembly ATPase PilB-like protein